MVLVLVMVMVIYGWMVQCLLLPFGFGNWRCTEYAHGIGPELRSLHAVMNDSSSKDVLLSQYLPLHPAVFAVGFLYSSPPQSTVVFQCFSPSEEHGHPPLPPPVMATPRGDDADLCMQVQDAECRHRLQGGARQPWS